jgi:phosphatidate cytidylyltransferase
MFLTIYLIILAYFLLGGIGFHFINRKKPPGKVKENRIKYITYFIIINVLFFSIVVEPVIFQLISFYIIGTGIWELVKLFKNSGFSLKLFFLLSLFLFVIVSLGFIHFGRLNSGLVLFTFLVLSIFDSFSQISGQLMGRRKIFPSISPEKTVEGLIGGVAVALASAMLLRGITQLAVTDTLLITAGIILFAFAGDVGTSFYKRKYHVKDFARILPGHGGFLDRFDSLIAGGAFVYVFSMLQI